jgi:hypothetical protein
MRHRARGQRSRRRSHRERAARPGVRATLRVVGRLLN